MTTDKAPTKRKRRTPAERAEVPPSSIHSMRVRDKLWERARARALDEGVSMNNLLNEILEGYAKGYVNFPRIVKVYGKDNGGAPAESGPGSTGATGGNGDA